MVFTGGEVKRESIKIELAYEWIKSTGDCKALKRKVLLAIHGITPPKQNMNISSTWGQLFENI